jgi:hypothetical protein
VRHLSIKGFEKHQHYKNRNPPWIKLHRSTLSDYAFGCLQDASKAHLMLLWLLASGVENKIPYDLPWIQKQLGANEPIDVEELILQGFIEVGQDDGKPLADRKQNAPLVEKRRGRVETEKRKTPDSGESGVPNSWPAEAAGMWDAAFAPIEPGLVGRHLKSMVKKFGWPTTKLGLQAYIQGTPDWKTPRIDTFAKEANKWIKWGQMPTTGENGEPTEWGTYLFETFKPRKSA